MRKMPFCGRWILGLTVLAISWNLAATPARAALLFNNNNQSQDQVGAFANTTFRLASDFHTGAASSTVTTAFLTMFDGDNINHTYTPKIFTDNSGLPGTLVGTMSTFTTNGNVLSFVKYTATSSGISLSPNTTYWMVLQMGENNNGQGATGWEQTTSQSTAAGSIFTTVSATQVKSSTNSGATWSDAFVGNTMFELDGTVPEPSVFLLTGLGAFIGLIPRYRRRRGGTSQSAQRN